MRILILFFSGLLFSSFSATAMPLSGQPLEAKQSLILKVQIQRACRRGYNFCSFDAYDRRGLCLQRARRMPPYQARRYRRHCYRVFNAAIKRCKRRFCRFYPYDRHIRPGINPDRLRPRRDLFN